MFFDEQNSRHIGNHKWKSSADTVVLDIFYLSLVAFNGHFPTGNESSTIPIHDSYDVIHIYDLDSLMDVWPMGMAPNEPL